MRTRVLIGLLLLTRSVSAQVTYDAATAAGLGSSASFTLAHTIGTCANCLILVGVSTHDISKTVTGVTWDGGAATKFCDAIGDSNTLEVWYRVAPTTGTHNVGVTLNGTAPAVIVAASFSGVSQASPVGVAACDFYTGSGTAHSDTTDGLPNGLLADFFVLNDGGGVITVNAGQTTRTGPSNHDDNNTIFTTKTGLFPLTTGYSWVSDFYRWAHAAVALNPAAVSGACRGMLGVLTCG